MAVRTDVSDLSAHLGFWLRAVSNQVSQAFAAKLEAEGVTVAEWVMLRLLYEAEAAAPSRLAEQMNMTRGGITKLVSRLVDRSLVLRRASPDDGRGQMLELTKAGTELVPKLAFLADSNDAEFFGSLSTADRQTLERLLKQIVRASGMPAMPIE
ncbi:MAG: MarR family transcriptional regulator [Rhizobiaceae bacterium]|nr:MarR family transcriptional regulator [Rhizobiaceae bacterium]